MKTIFMMALLLLGLFPAIKDGGKTNAEVCTVSSTLAPCSGDILVEVDDVSMRQWEVGVHSVCVYNFTNEEISVKDTDGGQGGPTYYLDPSDYKFFQADLERPDRLLITEGVQ